MQVIAVAYTHEQALALAKTQTGWRLPNVKELSSLVDRSPGVPSIDVTAFPATQAAYYWTSTPLPLGGNATPFGGNAWIVAFSLGFVDTRLRSDSNLVRLVR